MASRVFLLMAALFTPVGATAQVLSSALGADVPDAEPPASGPALAEGDIVVTA